MNIAESVKYVLKNKSQNLFTDFWKDDFKNIFLELGQEVKDFYHSSKSSIKNLKKDGVKVSFRDFYEGSVDALSIFKVLPKRMKDGFSQFKEDFITSLEELPDPKQKTIFCVKVFAALSSFALGSFYSIKRGRTDFSLPGLKKRNAFTQLLVAELVFKVTQLFIQRFLSEIEKEVTEPEDLKNIKYFKDLIADKSKYEEVINEESDKSMAIVEDLKNYIMHGERLTIAK